MDANETCVEALSIFLNPPEGCSNLFVLNYYGEHIIGSVLSGFSDRRLSLLKGLVGLKLYGMFIQSPGEVK